MTVELSQLKKILVLVGAAIVAAGAGLFLLEQGKSSSDTAATTSGIPNHSHGRAVAHPHATPAHHAANAAPTLTSGLPAPLHSALTHSKLVVAVVYTPGDPIDAAVLAQVRKGAKEQHVKVVTLDVRNDKVAAATANLMKDPFEPAVLVTKRPGTVVVELNGYTDSGAVAQAIADARR